MNKNIAIAGLGVVGKEVLDYINANQQYIAHNCNNNSPIIKAISTRKERNIENVTWYDNPINFFNDPEIDLVVELIGGADGVAYELVKMALSKKIDVVTANKALIAKHGNELIALAHKNNTALHFEASVAGAVPILKTLNDNLSANHINEITAILNGTCNFILSLMESEAMDFSVALQIAQEKGYAEADPTLDVNGTDAAHKIAILSSLAFKSFIDFNSVKFIGIENITNESFLIAKELNYKIKLIAKTILLENKIYHYVMPSFLLASNPLAQVNLSLNSIYIKSDLAADTILTGHGAGGKATASAVISDICDILRAHKNNLNSSYSKLGAVEKSSSYSMDYHFTGKYIWHSNDYDLVNKFKEFIKNHNVNIDSEKSIAGHNLFFISLSNYNIIIELSKIFPQAGLFML